MTEMFNKPSLGDAMLEGKRGRLNLSFLVRDFQKAGVVHQQNKSIDDKVANVSCNKMTGKKRSC